MAALKVGDIRKFSIYSNHFDAIVVYVNKRESYYDVFQSNGMKRSISFGSVVGKADVTVEQEEILKKIAEEYTRMIEANKKSSEYMFKANSHNSNIKILQEKLGYSKDY